MKNEKLAIAIPTYNRAEILKENLSYMIEEIKLFNIPLYISDDSNNDDTKQMIADFKDKHQYEYIYYSKNMPSLGHDKNCVRTLNLPEAEYIWYLGDSILIQKGSLTKTVTLLKDNNYDFIVTNHIRKNLTLPSKVFTNAKEVLLQLSWHLTLTGATIYNKKILQNLELRGTYKNFPQTAIILSYIPKKCNLYYESTVITFSNKNKVSYWNSNIFDVFAKDWYNLIYTLPDFYTRDEKLYAIKSHSVHTGIFGLKAMLKYKMLGIFDFNKYKEYEKYLQVVSQIPDPIVRLIALLPR